MSNYTIGDYVASSLPQLSFAAAAVAWSSASFLLGIRHGSLRSRMAAEMQRKQDKMPLLIFLIAVGAAIMIIVSALDGGFDRSSFTVLGLLVSSLLAREFAEAFSKNVLPVQMAVTGLLAFATLTYAALRSEVDDIRHDRWGARANTALLIKADSVIHATNLVVIAANSNYVFALDKTTKAALAISRDQIAAMSAKP